MRGETSSFQRYTNTRSLKEKKEEEEPAIDDASHQLHHGWHRAIQNRAGRWCLSPYVSSCFKITDFQEEMQPKLFPVSLKWNWVRGKYFGKVRGKEKRKQGRSLTGR